SVIGAISENAWSSVILLYNSTLFSYSCKFIACRIVCCVSFIDLWLYHKTTSVRSILIPPIITLAFSQQLVCPNSRMASTISAFIWSPITVQCLQHQFPHSSTLEATYLLILLKFCLLYR